MNHFLQPHGYGSWTRCERSGSPAGEHTRPSNAYDQQAGPSVDCRRLGSLTPPQDPRLDGAPNGRASSPCSWPINNERLPELRTLKRDSAAAEEARPARDVARPKNASAGSSSSGGAGGGYDAGTGCRTLRTGRHLDRREGVPVRQDSTLLKGTAFDVGSVASSARAVLGVRRFRTCRWGVPLAATRSFRPGAGPCPSAARCRRRWPGPALRSHPLEPGTAGEAGCSRR